MRNLTIKLPKHLHTFEGNRKPFKFDFRKTYFTIDGERTNHTFDVTDITHYDYTPLQQNMIVTLFEPNDIL